MRLDTRGPHPMLTGHLEQEKVLGLPAHERRSRTVTSCGVTDVDELIQRLNETLISIHGRRQHNMWQPRSDPRVIRCSTCSISRTKPRVALLSPGEDRRNCVVPNRPHNSASYSG